MTAPKEKINVSYCWPKEVTVEDGGVKAKVVCRALRGTPKNEGKEITLVIHGFFGIVDLIRLYFRALRDNAIRAQRLSDDRCDIIKTVIDKESVREPE